MLPTPRPNSNTVSGTPLKLVLDTNAALDGLLFLDPSMQAVMGAVRTGHCRWLASARTREEFRLVLQRASLQKYVSDSERMLSEYDLLTEQCNEADCSSSPLLRCRDVDDQPFLDLALRERASWLITRDRDLLCLARRARERRLMILAPQAWSATATTASP